MPETIFIGVAWPYANGSLHLGQMVGSYLPADIFARYHRLAGNRVLMVSGSDQHGTPITVRAEREGRTPAGGRRRVPPEFLAVARLARHLVRPLHHDRHRNHRETVHDIFLTLLGKGDIYKGTTQLFLLPEGRALPARPLRRGHVPELRLRERARRPVRQLRPHASTRAS